MNTTSVNGRQRKSLAEQIDRLDSLLDGLAEGLNEAIATAVQQAVKQVLTEVLTSAELQARLQPPAKVAQAAPTPSLASRLLGKLRQATGLLGSKVKLAAHAASNAAASVGQGCRAAFQHCQSRVHTLTRALASKTLTLWLLLHGLRHFAGFVVAALIVGTATGLGAYLLGPTIAAGISGASGFVAALAVQVGLWLKQTLLAWADGQP